MPRGSEAFGNLLPPGALLHAEYQETFESSQEERATVTATFEPLASPSPQPTKDRPADDNSSMSMTREELDARLQLVEARADARMSRFEERIDQAIGEMRRDRADIKTEMTDIKGEIKSTRTTYIVTAIASIISIVFGIASFNSTVLSNMVASFESGKSTTTAIAEATKRLESLQERIEAHQRQTATAPEPKK